MAEQAERRSLALAAQPGEQAGPARLGAEELAVEAGGGQMVGEERRRLLLVAGGVDGVEAEQLAEKLDGVRAQLRPGLGHRFLHPAEVTLGASH